MPTKIRLYCDDRPVEYPPSTHRTERGKVAFIPDAGVEFAAWLMLQWEREARASANVRAKDPQCVQQYTRGVIAATDNRMSVIQSLIESIRDSWSAKDWEEACSRVGMMLGAKADDGSYLHRLGGWTDEEMEITDGSGQS